MRKSCKAIIEKISIESGLEGGEGNKGAAEAGAHVGVTLEARRTHRPGSQWPQDSFAGIDNETGGGQSPSGDR